MTSSSPGKSRAEEEELGSAIASEANPTAEQRAALSLCSDGETEDSEESGLPEATQHTGED